MKLKYILSAVACHWMLIVQITNPFLSLQRTRHGKSVLECLGTILYMQYRPVYYEQIAGLKCCLESQGIV